MDTQKKILPKRNEEITDIIERMPTKFGRWVAVSVIIFTILVLTFGWAIKYPDTVTGQITINSNIAPVNLVAGSSGKIYLNGLQPRKQVRGGDYIAIIQNSANTADIVKITALITTFDLYQTSYLSAIDSFPGKVSLGELNTKYFSFLAALKNICNYEKENVYERQKQNQEEYIRWQHILLHQTENDTVTSTRKLALLKKWLDRKEGLYHKDMITEKEYDDLKTQYLNSFLENQQLQKSMTTIRIQIAEATGKLNLLKTEQTDKEQQMRLALLSSYNDLVDNIKNWEQKYAFKAPFNGQIEFLKFLTDNQFTQAGEEVFCIIPEKSTVIGQMLLPATGAGKVKTESRVIIKLDNYPYKEYGSVNGIVNTISLISKEQQIASNHIDSYLIDIRLPDELTTNYGKKLDFKYEIKGTADIIVNDRRLIERLFDNLKYRIK